MTKLDTGMIFAAGLGTRFRPITDTIPKPLVKVKNKPLIDYNFELFINYGLKKIVVNCFYHAEKLKNYIKQNYSGKSFEVEIIIEEERLETGGGLKHAIANTGIKPLFTLNSDIIFPDIKNKNPMRIMAENWNADKFDCLLLLVHKNDFLGYEGNGDFSINASGKIEKRQENEFVFTGLQIINNAILQNYPKKIFSLSEIFNLCLEKQRLGFIIHENKVLHVGDPEALKTAENYEF